MGGGQSARGRKLVNTQQAAAVYQLTEFPEYAHVSLPILDYYMAKTTGEADDELLRRSVIYTKRYLEAAKAQSPK